MALGLLPACDGEVAPGASSEAARPGAAGTVAEAPETSAVARFVGGMRCGGCHPAEAAAWRGSHHDLALQEAHDGSVLGDFDGASLRHPHGEARFFRRDGGFFVHTEGADGALREFPVAWTFGVDPLQQLLVPLEGGRVQALGVAWDARPAEAGGQRWMQLFPDAAPGSPRHWTGIDQNWNHMCAECHSTGLRKGYVPGAERYETTWVELDVSCEACHGPGAEHVAWAEASGAAAPAGRPGARGLAVDLPGRGAWRIAPGEAIAERTGPPPGSAELDACGRCHARRGSIAPDYTFGRSLLDTHRPALLDEGLYHADGQILDEVYVWGSFLQSRMHAAGVTCSDCHDPHALRIEEPDAACAGCHRSEVFAAPSHHRHREGSAGASCVSCHMPSRVYMEVDARRDHSFRVPRPDLSETLGTPNACTACHGEHAPGWAAEQVRRWFPDGRSGTPHYGEALHAGRRGALDGPERLRALADDASQPAIARASAVRLLGGVAGPSDAADVARAARDADPTLRLAAAGAAEALEPAARLAAAGSLLRDPLRAVRLEAAVALADVPPPLWQPAVRSALADALAEYREAQRADADRPEARFNLGVLHAKLAEPEAALAEYRAALRLDPTFSPAAVNLADGLRRLGREAEAEQVLRDALAHQAEAAELHHALGLALVRQGRAAEALAALAGAAERAPESARYAYVYAVALHGAGRAREARGLLERTHPRWPRDRDVLAALVALQREAGDRAAALESARRLLALEPDSPEARAAVSELSGAASGAERGRMVPAPPSDEPSARGRGSPPSPGL